MGQDREIKTCIGNYAIWGWSNENVRTQRFSTLTFTEPHGKTDWPGSRS